MSVFRLISMTSSGQILLTPKQKNVWQSNGYWSCVKVDSGNQIVQQDTVINKLVKNRASLPKNAFFSASYPLPS